ncbi:MAG: chemotaxis protein CheW, partial [Lachnospiraceae bacterium]|nr:chemotaxis protein CheW [Lachnospiraceae bacterium]
TSYKIRPLPMVPDYIRGIINLRGQVVPVIDIRLRMGRPLLEYTDSTCIIILSIGDTSVGITVDFVAQVLDIDREDICPIPVNNRQELSSSMIHLKDGSVVLFLDCEQLIRQY